MSCGGGSERDVEALLDVVVVFDLYLGLKVKPDDSDIAVFIAKGDAEARHEMSVSLISHQCCA